jgi:hypothetical protein
VSWHINLEAPTGGITSMTLAQLRDKKEKQLFMKIGWDRKGYGKEIHMREQELCDDSRWSTESTLYDAWASRKGLYGPWIVGLAVAQSLVATFPEV